MSVQDFFLVISIIHQLIPVSSWHWAIVISGTGTGILSVWVIPGRRSIVSRIPGIVIPTGVAAKHSKINCVLMQMLNHLNWLTKLNSRLSELQRCILPRFLTCLLSCNGHLLVMDNHPFWTSWSLCVVVVDHKDPCPLTWELRIVTWLLKWLHTFDKP